MDMKMEVGVEEEALLLDPLSDDTITGEKTNFHLAMSQTFLSTADLIKLLPTGTVLVFQLLSPSLSDGGDCDIVGQVLTAALIALCSLSCFLLTFTDSFKDKKGNLCYGFVTPHGMWIIDGPAKLPPHLADKYRLRMMDFVHAFLSVLVFVAITLLNQSVVHCFYPASSGRLKELMEKLPLAIGAICSMMFVAFPTHRHGIGCPFDHKQLTHDDV